jgi:hypothetical protein
MLRFLHKYKIALALTQIHHLSPVEDQVIPEVSSEISVETEQKISLWQHC